MSNSVPNWLLTRVSGFEDKETPDWVRKNTQPPEDIFKDSVIDAPDEEIDTVDVSEQEDLIDIYEGGPSDISWDFKYFKPQEFASKGNGQVKIHSKVVQGLDNVRAEMSIPIRITSGYRDPKHNKRVGGATNSQHVLGNAVDINLHGMDDTQKTQLMVSLMKQGFTSFGSYTRSPNMLHTDIRPKARKWHHGSGGHPQWFSQALKEGDWKRG